MVTASQAWWKNSGGYLAEVLSVLAAQPHLPVIRYQGTAITGAEHIRSVAGTYRALRKAGVGRGTVVAALFVANSPEMIQVRHAAHLLGAAVCYLRSTNPGSSAVMLSIADQLDILRATGATVLYADRASARRARELVDRAGIALVEAGLPEAAPTTDPGPVDPLDPDPADLASIMFTSGSTGRPKGIRISRRAWEGSVLNTAASVREFEPITYLFSTPLSHTVGPMVDGVLAASGSVVLLPEFDPDAVLRAMAELAVSQTFMSTTHLYRLLDLLDERGHRDAAAAGLTRLRSLIYGGSAASPARIAAARAMFGPALSQMYGSSESFRISYLTAAEHADPDLAGSVGRPFPEVEVGIVDHDTGAPLADGSVGEIRVRSSQLMDGYLDDELTPQVLRDGWYHTGDIGYRDDRGYLHLLDRVADVVKIDGTKVYPAVVEREVATFPGVGLAVVYGLRDENGGEHLHAAITRRPDASVDPDEIRDHITAVMSAAHSPELVLLLDEIPVNASGKPDRIRLRQLSAARLATNTPEIDTAGARRPSIPGGPRR